jgi:2-dehydropantoate 2-reductase
VPDGTSPYSCAVRIAVFGTGGVGGYYGGRLARAGLDVQFLARGEHLRVLRDAGLRVRSVKGDFNVRVSATDRTEEIGASDYVLFCVKSFDTEEAAQALKPLIDSETAVVSLQNGIDNEEKIAEQVGWEHVMGGAAYVFSTIAEPGVIEHTGGPDRIAFGEWDGNESPRARELLQIFQKAEIDAALSDDIRAVLWEKFAFICAQAGVTAAVRLPIGDIRAVPEGLELFRCVVEEVREVAAAEGVGLAADAADRAAALVQKLEPSATSSLHFDMTHGKRMELETLHGTVVRRAKRHGIAAPMSEAIYSVLKPWAVRNERP